MENINLPDMSPLTRRFTEQIKLSTESLQSTLARAAEAARSFARLQTTAQLPATPFVPTHEEVPFLALPQTIQYVAEQAVGGEVDTELLKSMLPRTVLAKRVAPHHHQIFLAPIADRIKWRRKMAEKFGMSLEVFRDERIDANSKTDDLEILKAMRLLESTAPETKGKCRKTAGNRQCRGGVGYTQVEASKRVHVSVDTIRRWDNGRCPYEGYPGRGNAVVFEAWLSRIAEGRLLKRAIAKAVPYDEKQLSHNLRN